MTLKKKLLIAISMLTLPLISLYTVTNALNIKASLFFENLLIGFGFTLAYFLLLFSCKVITSFDKKFIKYIPPQTFKYFSIAGLFLFQLMCLFSLGVFPLKTESSPDILSIKLSILLGSIMSIYFYSHVLLTRGNRDVTTSES
ncbi:hypothetical protein A1QO_06255 [Vibrio genomosp. F10 str. ZF-129]|uniref:Uncharacterized protein n=1 Tax=Vibrio genomosp. F10 str. ZF-129 TaxID=1187848 RepID=A0A1E5BG36_9VIBR|nr:hypothetical protein A1QO_06255 [Vibrio genomosp. F10 str. ZF-129]